MLDDQPKLLFRDWVSWDASGHEFKKIAIEKNDFKMKTFNYAIKQEG